jgi:outer membrane receptor protein involved in Fe transport
VTSKPGLAARSGFLLPALVAGAAMAQNPAEVVEMGRVDIVATTPLPGIGMPLSKVPANVQMFTSRDFGAQRPLGLPDLLERSASSVTVNSGQGNAFQPDVSYRGFTASPLLGSPQGLSVYQDGVRINEAFGDVVNWDLIPRSAIASVQLIPGSNPAFGLNTLGGALAVYTKSGAHYPGGALEAQGGSFRRRSVELVQGGSRGNWDYFASANVMNDGGWAAQNSSRIRQFFAKIGHQTERSDLDTSLTVADNTLNGTQTLPRSFFSDDIRQPYTYPDRNRNRLAFLALKGSRFLEGDILLGGTAYVRKFRNENVASNVNDHFGDSPGPGGEIDTLQAINDRSLVDQTSHGLGVQFTFPAKRGVMDNQLVLGGSGDFGRARFTRYEQDAEFTPSRSAAGIGEFDATTDASSRTTHLAAFASNSLSIGERWVLTVSGRYNVSRIRIADESGRDPALAGNHRFARLNPAAGINFNPHAGLTSYVAYNESMRPPSAMELTCADPGAPCKLPGSFLADPPLRAVRARTIETGARGTWNESATWSVAVYRSELEDDIQFVASTGVAVNTGYFRNVGATRREGVELATTARWGAMELAARYSHIRATFRSPFLENSPNNSSADAAGAISVERGQGMPGIPRNSLKLRVGYDSQGAWSAGSTLTAGSSSYARGDENNRDANGRIPGYAVVHVDARWRAAKNIELFFLADNVFDKRYANVGVLGRNFFLGPGRTFSAENAVAEQFLGPGTPRGAWAGLRYQWL